MKWRIDFTEGNYYEVEADYVEYGAARDDCRVGTHSVIQLWKRVETGTKNPSSELVGTYYNPRAVYQIKE